MRYLILEVHTLYAIALDQDGTFIKIYNKDYQVGMEVESIELIKEAAPKKKGLRSIYPLIAVFAVFIFFFAFDIYMDSIVTDSLLFRINPSVKIDVNRDDDVIGISGLNDDGAYLIDGYDYDGKDIDIVFDELMDRAIDLGYLYQGQTIAIEFVSNDATWIKEKREAIDDTLIHLKDDLEVKITITDQSGHEEIIMPEIVIESDSSYDDDDYGDIDDATTPQVTPAPTISPDTTKDSEYEYSEASSNYADSRYDEENSSNYDD